MEGTMPAGMQHEGHSVAAMVMVMDEHGAPHHAHHGSDMQSKSTDDAITTISSLGCQCGCNCLSAGCISNASGIASLNTTGFFEPAAAVFPLHESPTSLRSAHGLDLIRPPSKS